MTKRIEMNQNDFLINRVLFLGSKHLGLHCLEQIYSMHPSSLIGVITINDRNDTRTVYDGFQEFARHTKVPLYVAGNRKDSEKLVYELKPDLCFVVGWYWLISESTLKAVPHGFIGIHNSLLPKYRGSSPLIWAIINNEHEVGFSVFSITEGIDDGPIWAQASVTLEEGDYISDILKKLEEKTVQVLREKYLDILKCNIKPVEQKHQEATFCARRYPNDGVIDWRKSAECVYNFIRAQSSPYPGAFTYFEGHKLIVWKARPEKVTYYGTPGQVARVGSEGVYVTCGDQKPIILERVEWKNKKERAHNIIKSIKIRFPTLPIQKEQIELLT